MYDTHISRSSEKGLTSQGDRVLCHYTGRLAGGAEFDSTAGKEPFEFVVGVGHVIQGWDLALQELSKGQKAKSIPRFNAPLTFVQFGSQRITVTAHRA